MEDPYIIDFQIGGTLQIASRKKPVGSAIVTLIYDGFQVTSQPKDNHMSYTLANDHKVQVQISYVDAKGNPAAVDGAVTWASSNDAVLTVEVDPSDSTLATVLPGDQLSQAQVVATADADLGEGTKQIITTMDVTIVAGAAVSGTIAPVGEAVPIT